MRCTSLNLVMFATATLLGCASGSGPGDEPSGLELETSSFPQFGYPTGDRVTYPAGGGSWFVSQPLGHWSNISPFIGNHQAEDIRNGTSDTTTFQPVYSIGDGQVLYAGPNGSTYVNVVLIRHDLPGADPVCSFYGHIDGLKVTAGQHVSRGQQVARIMDWAAQVAPYGQKNSHLHYVILPWDLCQASANTSGALVCGYDNGIDDAFHENMTLDQEPDSYKPVSNACLDQKYAPLIAPSKFIRAHSSATPPASAPVPSVAAVTYRDGATEMLAVGSDGRMWHRHVDPAGTWAPQWDWYSDNTDFGPVTPTVVDYPDGGHEVLTVGKDGRMWHRHVDPTGTWAPQWDWWSTNTDYAAAAPSVVTYADGAHEVLAVGKDGRMWHRHVDKAGAWAPQWDWWSDNTDYGVASPAVVWFPGGAQEVLAVGKDGRMWHRHVDAAGNWAPHWDWWSDNTDYATASPAVITYVDGGHELLAVGKDGRMWHRHVDAAGNWAPRWDWWSTNTDFAPARSVGLTYKDGALEVLAIGKDGRMWHRHVDAAGAWAAQWDWWSNNTDFAAGAPAVASYPSGAHEALAIGKDGRMWHRHVDTVGNWAPQWDWWSASTPFAH